MSQQVLCSLRCFTLWLLGAFRTPPGLSWGCFRTRNGKQRPKSRKKTNNECASTFVRNQNEKHLTPSLLSTDVDLMRCKQVFKHEQHITVWEMGCPQWKLLPDPITIMLSIPEAPKHHGGSSLGEALPPLSPHFNQPRPGYMALLQPLHLSDI